MKLVLSDAMLVKRNGGRWRPEKQCHKLPGNHQSNGIEWVDTIIEVNASTCFVHRQRWKTRETGGGGEWVKLSCNGEGWLSSRTAYIFKNGGEI